mmetsp:Transcript_73040/g.171274  ORF Transcript_73040/g.171274 Transcript_73040/m.171274 type:complete len:760 (+) Transcript_73040:54-2333(+)
MQIYVKTCTGKRPPLEVLDGDTVSNVKRQICDKEGISPGQFVLCFAGEHLADERLLKTYSIQDQDTIELERAEHEVDASADKERPVSVTLQRLSGDISKFEAASTDSTEELKQRIFQAFDIPPADQTLIFQTQQLQSGQRPFKMLAERDHTITMVIKLPMMSLTVHLMNRMKFDLSVSPNETVSRLKELIQERATEEGHTVPPEKQLLVHAGKQLVDASLSLAECNINGTIFCVLRTPKTYEICVKSISTDQAFQLSVAPSDTILDVKEQIQKATEVPADRQRLVFAGKQMSDSSTIQECKIESGSTVHVVSKTASTPKPYKITVKVLSGQSFELDVGPADSILDVKEEIQKLTGFAADKQRLVFAGKQLSDTSTVQECKIEDGNTLHLVMRLNVSPVGSSSSSDALSRDMRGPCPSPGACGLANLGNTCYLNSTLQALSNTVALRRYYEEGRYKDDISSTPDSMGGRLADGFANLLRSIWGGEFTYVGPNEVRNLISEKWGQFAGYRQHDAQELLMFLLDGLHEDVKRVSSLPSQPTSFPSSSSQSSSPADTQDMVTRQQDSKIMDIFHFQVRSQISFCDVGARSEKFEPMVYLTLPIPSVADSLTPERSLEDCLQAFSKEEELCTDDWVWCDQTQQRERSMKKIEIWSAPECLIIHLKRFVADASSIEKVDAFVRFPFELNLADWVSGPDREGEVDYQLYAVVNHSGSLSYGHYTAYCKVGEGSDKKWYLFNDARVTPASEADVVSQEAYLLFYERL